MTETTGPIELAARAAFYGVAALTLAGAVVCVSARDLFRAALGLALALFGVAAVYLMLQAEFLAVAQLLIYVGAILVLILFSIMLTARISDPNRPRWNRQWKWVLGLAAVIGLGLAGLLAGAPWGGAGPDGPPVPVAALGRLLLSPYLLGFELLSVLLLGALVGALYIARREPEP